MNIPRDKILHIGLGLIWLAVTLIGYWLLQGYGLGAMLAWGTTAYGVLYEVQQWVRKEGQVEALDALATAAPGWVAWGVLTLI